MYKHLIRLLIAVSISLTACMSGRSGEPSEPTLTPPPETAPPLVDENILDPTPTPDPASGKSAVDLETPAAWENCKPNAAFVADITIPDNSQIHPGALFKKTWRIENNGACPWPEGTRLVFQKGDALNAPHQIPLTGVAPNRKVDVGLDMQAPLNPGTYRGYWRLQSPDGEIFGAVLYIQIVVTETPVPLTPTAAPSSQPTATPPPPTPTGQVSTSTPATPTTLPPTETLTVSPTPSPTPEPDASGAEPTEPIQTPPTCLAPDPMFTSVLHQAEILGIGLRCATGPTSQHSGRLQFFRANLDQASAHDHNRSVMLYDADTELVYAFKGRDPNIYEATVEIYANRWDESQPEVAPICEALAPSTGYRMPMREIGKAWCENSLWLEIGWPREPAMAGTFTVQEMTQGLLMRVEPKPGQPAAQALLIAVDMETQQSTTIPVP
jgi:hypothetical protein